MTGSDFSEITKTTPEKSLVTSLKKNAGRNNQGKITVRHQGGGNRRKYRLIDFKRNKKDGNSSNCNWYRVRSKTEQQTSHLSAMQMVRNHIFLLQQDLQTE